MTTLAPAPGTAAPTTPEPRPRSRPHRRHRGRLARRDEVVRASWTGLLVISLAAVTGLWLAGGGLRTLTSATAAFDSLGRLSGLVASDLLLAQVLLMARVPWIERAHGQDRLATIHRWVGFGSFTLMVVHVVTITIGYADVNPGQVWQTLTNLVLTYPAMLLAAAGTTCLVAVTASSIRASRRRLRYESWHLLHLYAYLGVGLALPHQLWTGTDFLASPFATAFWWTAWGATVVAVVLFRVALPLTRTLRHGVHVTAVVREASDVVSVHLGGRRLHRLPVEAGQAVTWRFTGAAGASHGHPYSLSAAPDGRSLRVTVKEVGDGTRSLTALTPGSRVLLEGPYGRLTERVRTRDKLAFLGAGVGITPLRALAEGMEYAPGDAVLIQRYTHEALFARELDVLARERGLAVGWLAGRRRSDESWLPRGSWPDDATALRQLVPDIVERDLYLCGAEPWVEAVRRSALAAGVPPGQVHTESFAW